MRKPAGGQQLVSVQAGKEELTLVRVIAIRRSDAFAVSAGSLIMWMLEGHV